MTGGNDVEAALTDEEQEALLIASHTVEPVQHTGRALFAAVERILAARAADEAETVGQCRCDGSAYHSDEENAARHPFVRHPDCPVHAAQPPARRAEDVLAEGIRLALYEGGLWCGECDPADQDDDCCVVAPRIRAALLDADGGD